MWDLRIIHYSLLRTPPGLSCPSSYRRRPRNPFVGVTTVSVHSKIDGSSKSKDPRLLRSPQKPSARGSSRSRGRTMKSRVTTQAKDGICLGRASAPVSLKSLPPIVSLSSVHYR